MHVKINKFGLSPWKGGSLKILQSAIGRKWDKPVCVRRDQVYTHGIYDEKEWMTHKSTDLRHYCSSRLNAYSRIRKACNEQLQCDVRPKDNEAPPSGSCRKLKACIHRKIIRDKCEDKKTSYYNWVKYLCISQAKGYKMKLNVVNVIFVKYVKKNFHLPLSDFFSKLTQKTYSH